MSERHELGEQYWTYVQRRLRDIVMTEIHVEHTWCPKCSPGTGRLQLAFEGCATHSGTDYAPHSDRDLLLLGSSCAQSAL